MCFFIVVVCLFFGFCFALFLQKDHGCVPLAVVTIPSLYPLSPPSIEFSQIVSQQVTLVEERLLFLLEHLRLLLVFSGVLVAQYLAFCVMFYLPLFVLLAIVLSVLRFTASDYPIGVFSYDFIVHLFVGRI